MASILVLTHEHDRFRSRGYMVEDFFAHWAAAGHRVRVHEGGRDAPPADLAILHVDRTVVQEPYLEALTRYPRVLNGAVADIGKRRLSAHLVGPDDDYRGPVIVKTDLNCLGEPEKFHRSHGSNWRAVASLPGRVRQWRPWRSGRDTRRWRERYRVYRTPALVPESIWTDPGLVVEKFLPEHDERGYYLRTWMFLGDRERCSRILGPHPIVKASDAIERVFVPVPDEMRDARRRLGFDYGKFDFVIHDGTPVLLDANRTPSLPANLSQAMMKVNSELARGIEVFLP